MGTTPEQEVVDVIDDDSAARDGLSALVASMGLTCRTSASAEEFLEHSREQHSICIVADLRLPGMNGLDLVEQLQEREDAAPIIIVSAFATVPLAVRLMRRGAFTVIEKPCRSQEVCEHINQAIRRYRANFVRVAKTRELQERFDRLTASERAVGAGIANGIPNAILAGRLQLGLRTVEKRRQQVFRKLHVDTLPGLIEVFYHVAPKLLQDENSTAS